MRRGAASAFLGLAFALVAGDQVGARPRKAASPQHLLLRGSRSVTTCVGTERKVTGTERWTDEDDVCAGGIVLFQHRVEYREVRQVVVGFEQYNCKNVSYTVEQVVTTKRVVQEEVAVTKFREVEECVAYGSRQSGTTACYQRCEDDSNSWCRTTCPQYETFCKSYRTVVEEYTEMELQDRVVVENATVATVKYREECESRPVVEREEVVRSIVRDDNCETTLYETAVVRQPCDNGACTGALCVCTDGWQGADCSVDVPECSTDNGGCDQTCTEAPGSFSCSCRAGYRLAGDVSCLDVNECAVGNGGCDQECVNTVGSYYCRCDKGYLLDGDGKTCSDRNECIFNRGGCQQLCVNTPGGFECMCNDGYQLFDDVTCADNDECEEPGSCYASDGSDSFVCYNTPGSYSCVCAAGYRLAPGSASECRPVTCGQPLFSYCGPGTSLQDSCRAPTATCPGGLTFGSTCTLACSDGSFVLEGPATGAENTAGDNTRTIDLTCGADGEWSRHDRAWCRRLNEAPTDITLSGAATVPEGVGGAIVGTLSAVDGVPEGDVHTFTVVAPADGGAADGAVFAVQGTQLVLRAAQDYEAGRRELRVTVRAVDSFGAALNRVLAVRVLDVNEPPSAVSLHPGAVSEGAPEGTVVGQLVAADPDEGNSHTFSLAAPSDLFAVQGAQLVLRQRVDYEAVEAATVDVRATDDGDPAQSVVARLRVAVSDGNEAPSGLAVARSLLPESSEVGDVVTEVLVVDQDNLRNQPWLLSRRVQQHTLSICGGPDADYFRVEGLSLRLARSVNYEAAPALTVCLVARDDGGLSSPEQAVTIFVQDVSERPQVHRLWPDTVPETAPGSPSAPPAVVTTVEVFDEDLDEELTFALVGSAKGLVEFAGDAVCSRASGDGLPAPLSPELTYTRCAAGLRLLRALDYEDQAALRVLVRVRDTEGVEYITELTLNVANVNEAPFQPALSLRAVRENAAAGQLVAELSVRDPDRADRHVFAIASQTPDGAFAVQGNELAVADSTLLDHERHPTVEVEVIVTDSGAPALSTRQTFAIEVKDANEAPTALWLRPVTVPTNASDGGRSVAVPENATVGSVIGKIVVDDPDNDSPSGRLEGSGAAQTHRCGFSTPPVPGPDTVPAGTVALPALFGLDDNLQLFVARAGLDYERQKQHVVRVTCVDDGTPARDISAVFAVNVTDVNEPPRMIVLSGTAVSENAVAGTLVASITTVDPDLDGAAAGGDNSFHFAYTVVTAAGEEGGDAAPFAATSAGDLVTTRPLNHEQTPRVALYLRSTDAGGLSLTQEFAVDVLDSNDPPTEVTLTPQIVPERVQGATVGRLSTADEDRGQRHTYALVDPLTTDAALFRIRAADNTLALAAGVEADYEDAQELRVVVEARDSGTPLSRSVRRQFVIAVRDVNEPVEEVLFSSPDGRRTVPESAGRGAYLGRFLVADGDNSNPAFRQQAHSCVVAGGDHGLYANGTRLFAGARPIDFELQPELQVGVTCTDSGNPPSALEVSLRLPVSNDNEPPRDLRLDGQRVGQGALRLAENADQPRRLGRLSVTDPDNACQHAACPPPQHHVFSLAASADGVGGAAVIEEHFRLTPDGELWTGPLPLDYENQTGFLASPTGETGITVVVVDSGSPPQRLVARLPIVIGDVNDAPTAVRLETTAVAEGAAPGRLVSRLLVDDEDVGEGANGQHRFWINYESAGDGLPFAVTGDGLYLGGDVDYERRPSYTFEVFAQDRGTPPLTTSTLVTVAVTDVNEPPAAYMAGNPSMPGTGSPSNGAGRAEIRVSEGEPVGYRIGDLIVSDEDSGAAGVVTCAVDLGSCADGCRYGACLAGSLACPAAPVEVRGITLTLAAPLNYEANSSLPLRVVCRDNGRPEPLWSAPLELAIAVQDANDAPALALATLGLGVTRLEAGPGGADRVRLGESLVSGSVVATFSVADEDAGQTHAFGVRRVPTTPAAPQEQGEGAAAAAAAADSWFAMEGSRLVVAAGAELDYEAVRRLLLEVTVTDSGTAAASGVLPLVVVLDDVNEAPSGIAVSCGCTSAPCLNGGRCRDINDGTGSHTCECGEGFSGVQCERSSLAVDTADPSDDASACLVVNANTPPGRVMAWLAVDDADAGDTPALVASAALADTGLALEDNRLVLVRPVATDPQGISFRLTATDGGNLSASRVLTVTSSACAAGQHACSPQATCTPLGGAGPDGRGYECSCRPGYVGDGRLCVQRVCLHPRPGQVCTELTDTCASEPCANGGACSDGRTSDGRPTYTCLCADAWTGPRCEERVNGCAAQPCYNGGTCLHPRGAATVSCACPEGYAGGFCQVDETACARSACPDGASCVMSLLAQPGVQGFACVRGDRALALLYTSAVPGGCGTGDFRVACAGTWAADLATFEAFATAALVADKATEQLHVGRVEEVAGVGTLVHVSLFGAAEPAGMPQVQLYRRLQAACGGAAAVAVASGFCGHSVYHDSVASTTPAATSTTTAAGPLGNGGAGGTSGDEGAGGNVTVYAIAGTLVLLLLLLAVWVFRQRNTQITTVLGGASASNRPVVSFENPSYSNPNHGAAGPHPAGGWTTLEEAEAEAEEGGRKHRITEEDECAGYLDVLETARMDNPETAQGHQAQANPLFRGSPADSPDGPRPPPSPAKRLTYTGKRW